jgi:hypothetical protein
LAGGDTGRGRADEHHADRHAALAPVEAAGTSDVPRAVGPSLSPAKGIRPPHRPLAAEHRLANLPIGQESGTIPYRKPSSPQSAPRQRGKIGSVVADWSPRRGGIWGTDALGPRPLRCTDRTGPKQCPPIRDYRQEKRHIPAFIFLVVGVVGPLRRRKELDIPGGDGHRVGWFRN